MTEITRSQIQLRTVNTTEMRFLHRVAGLSLKSSGEKLKVEQLLLHIERSQLRWFGDLAKSGEGRVHLGRHPGADNGGIKSVW